MISFKLFVSAIHDAIMGASDKLMDKNVGLLDKYFESNIVSSKDSEGNIKQKEVLTPKTVTINYPQLHDGEDVDPSNQSNYEVKVLPIEVPLITLVPLSMSQVEKATLTAEFEMEIIDGELQLNFTNRSNNFFNKKPKTTRGTLEITLSPQETSEGLKLLVESYESFLKRQIS